MNKNKLKVCVIIPAYNEASVIESVIKDAAIHFSKSNHSISIVVVDDGSRDTTISKAKKAGAIVISHITNTGVGGATATGLYYAKKNGFDIVATMDADGQHDPQDVMNGIDELIKRRVDLLIGSRLIDSKGMSTLKVIGNKGLGAITYLLFGVTSTDSQSGLRVLSRRAIERLSWQSDGYEFCSEMLWRAKQQKLKIDEYPIKTIYTTYSKQKGQNNWNGVNIVKTLIKRRVSEWF
jgi:glycosyltransferase involved in cell wall biosynthesis